MDSLIQKQLWKHRIGISISGGNDDLSAHGFDEKDVNRVVRVIAETLLSHGGRLVFGQDWRPDGIMAEVLRLAQTYQSSGSRLQNYEDNNPMMVACVAWPDEPYADYSELQRLRGILSVEIVGNPETLPHLPTRVHRVESVRAEAETRYLRARSLTAMRHFLTEKCTARICLGGKMRGSSGRFPGIIEEALFALRAKKPLYLSGLLGGAAQSLIEAIHGETTMPPDFCKPDPKIVHAFGLCANKRPNEDDSLKPVEVWKEFRRFGLAGLSALNGLSPVQNKQMFNAVTLNEVVGWLVMGLAKKRVE